MFDRDLELDERSVRGSLVVGLSDKDMRLLDVFEGDVSTNPFKVRQLEIHLTTAGIHTGTGSCPPTWFLGGRRRHGRTRSGSPCTSAERARDTVGGEHLCVVPAIVRIATEAMGVR